jgi:hypothetical protein
MQVVIITQDQERARRDTQAAASSGAQYLAHMAEIPRGGLLGRFRAPRRFHIVRVWR